MPEEHKLKIEQTDEMDVLVEVYHEGEDYILSAMRYGDGLNVEGIDAIRNLHEFLGMALSKIDGPVPKSFRKDS